jgi:hypothetical protein
MMKDDPVFWQVGVQINRAAAEHSTGRPPGRDASQRPSDKNARSSLR